MALFSLLAQLVGLGVAIYLMFTRSFTIGLGLVAAVSLGHFVFTKLSNGLMSIHQRTLSTEARHDLELRALSGSHLGTVPRAWSRIASFCAALYVAFVVAVVWYALGK